MHFPWNTQNFSYNDMAYECRFSPFFAQFLALFSMIEIGGESIVKEIGVTIAHVMIKA